MTFTKIPTSLCIQYINMQKYKVVHQNSKIYTLSKDGQDVGSLNYKSWFSYNGLILTVEGGKYKFTPDGYFKWRITTVDKRTNLAIVSSDWKGLNITLLTDEGDKSYKLRMNGLLKFIFTLKDSNDHTVLTATMDMNWKKFRMEYNIEAMDEVEQMAMNDILLFATIHCLRYNSFLLAAAA